MKVLITGSSGLVGSALVRDLLSDGHTVCRLVRKGSSSKVGSTDDERASQGFDVNWDPATGELGGAAVGADAVVNLAGASIADGRWTAARKELIRSSRVDGTRALVQALARMAARPRVLVSASAVGIYGDRGDELLTEESAPGKDFLSGIATAWEAEALKAESLGIRVVLARFGVILSKNGGALPQMMQPFRFGLGGKLGSGSQWMSWIMLEDVVGLLLVTMENGNMRGPVNFASPQPVRNSEFTQILAQVMHRPAVFTAPGFALRMAMGEMADALLLSSQRCAPKQAESARFQFQYPSVKEALEHVLEGR